MIHSNLEIEIIFIGNGGLNVQRPTVINQANRDMNYY